MEKYGRSFGGLALGLLVDNDDDDGGHGRVFSLTRDELSSLGALLMPPLFEFEPELVLRLAGAFLFFLRCLGPF